MRKAFDSMHGRRTRWAATVVLAGLAVAGSAVGRTSPPAPMSPAAGGPTVLPEASEASPAAMLSRVAAVGASVTHGFNAQILVEARGRIQPAILSLGDALAAAVGGNAEVSVAGSLFFFRDPEHWGPTLLRQALETRPTSVVAVDYLFWFGYGSTGHPPGTEGDATARRQRLERGLSLLAELANQIPGHLLVGDLPDMSGAVGRMLSASQVPDEATRRRLNDRIAAWVAERPSAVLVPLSAIMEQLLAGERFGASEAVPLLKPDRLHPTADGLVVVAREIVARLVAARGRAAVPDAAADHEAAIRRLRARLAARIEAAAREDAPAGAGAS